jgi:hypothetical protein
MCDKMTFYKQTTGLRLNLFCLIRSGKNTNYVYDMFSGESPTYIGKTQQQHYIHWADLRIVWSIRNRDLSQSVPLGDEYCEEVTPVLQRCKSPALFGPFTVDLTLVAPTVF